MAQTQKVLQLGNRTITLIGTAHISNESVQEVCATIREKNPDCVCIELDERRREQILNPNSWKEMDIVQVLRRGDAALMLANLILSSFQKRMGNNVGVKPGQEMLSAMQTATELGIPVSMVDRPIKVTLRRAWAKNSFWGKMKLLASLIASAFDTEEVSTEQIETLKSSNEMDMMMQELSDYLPTVKEVLIDERDRYLASHIWLSNGDNICAVLGAGHLPGVEAHLSKLANGQENSDTSDISEVPPKSFIGKLAPYIIPAVIVAIIVLGFIFGGLAMGKNMVISWLLWNGILSAIGALIAAGHPLTILSSFLAAPFTSLTPVVGVGIVAGIVQAVIVKPKISDMESLQDDSGSLKGWYRNRILRTLLVFILSSLGSSAGTFIGGANIIVLFSTIADKVRSIFVK